MDYLLIGIIVGIGLLASFILFVIYTAPQENLVRVIPKFSEDQIVEIVKSDLSNHVGKIVRIYVGPYNLTVQTLNHYNFPSEIVEGHLPLRYTDMKGVQFAVNNTNYSIIGNGCIVKDNSSCGIVKKEMIDALRGKLTYFVDIFFTSSIGGSEEFYLVDAVNGEIVYSTSNWKTFIKKD